MTGAESIQWIVDGLPSTRPEIRSRGISESDLIVINASTGSFRRNISIERNVMNKNTSIVCVADLIFSADVPSEPVLFRVQGLLDAPSNLLLSELEVDNQHVIMRRLSWEKPFSLDITDVDPDISHYKVCYSLISATETSRCSTGNHTTFTFLYINIPLLFTVSAVNIVGEGNTSSILHNGNGCITTGLVTLVIFIAVVNFLL